MWFRELVGFEETTPEKVRAQLRVEASRMTSLANGREMGCGHLQLVSLAELRERSTDVVVNRGPSTFRELVGDAGGLHRDPANGGAVFQAASQFNLLEMVSPDVTPEAGIDGYERDPTQGPACAVACGAGTIYRNYFVEVDGRPGQSAARQLDGLDAVGRLLFPDGSKGWTMRNGYALFDRQGLETINARLGSMNGTTRDTVRAALKVGLHVDVEVTSAPTGHHVTQVYCSALPVAYNRHPSELFEPFARLVLEATYEATVRAAALTAAETGNRTVFLTMVGGGVFGNEQAWIVDALERALHVVTDAGLDIVMVSFGAPNSALGALI